MKAITVLGCLLILGGSLALTTGCGGSGDTTAPPADQAAAKSKRPPTPHSEIVRYMERRFGNESWYPLIVRIEAASGGSVVVVDTKLTNHKTPRWNQKQAAVMCKALLTSPVVKSAHVLYDSRTGYPVFSCPS
ncbi:MAG: hypothetical protein ACTHNY_11005 [Solirubrobacterales bacterium]